MKKIFIIVFLIVSAMTLSALSKKPKEVEIKKEAQHFNLQGYNLGMQDFGFNLLREINTTGEENLFISPFSIAEALSMLNNGASGETREEIESLFKLKGLDLKQFNLANQSKVHNLLETGSDVQLNIANSIWHRKGMEVEKGFLETNKTFYNAKIASLDFNDPVAAKEINDWVAEQTKDKISKIVENNLDPMLMMLLVNAVYFKGNWDIPFNPKRTRPITFDDRFKCQMMSIKESFPYLYDKSVQVIDLPYGEEGDYSMLVALPDKDSSLAEIVNRLDGDVWNYWLENLKRTDGSLQLPKFELSYQLSLNDVLSNLGMKRAFNPQEAEFENISKTTDLFVSKVLHKTYLKVDEEGTEAAAVTSVGMETTSIKPAGFIMNVNRPFLCIIHNNAEILFIGLIKTPKIAKE